MPTGRRQKAGLLPSLTIHRLLVLIVFIAIFTMAVRVPIAPDTWWHLRTGQYIVENRAVPITDPYTHTHLGQFWLDGSWLSQVFWYGLFALGGWAALALGVAALVTASFWLAWLQVERANVFVAAFVTILGAVVSAVAWIARPHMLSFFMTALLAYLLHRFKRHEGRLLPWVPLMMLAWANFHGGYAIGLMLMLVYLVGETANHLARHQADPVASWARLRMLGLTLLISLAVVVINPQGWRLWWFPFQTVGIGALRDFIQEWQSPNFHMREAQPFILMLLLLAAALSRAGRRVDWTDLGLVGLWTAWALFAGRHIATFALVTTPILARYADLAWTDQWRRWGYERPPFAGSGSRLKTRLNWLLLALVAAAALVKISLPLSAETNLQVEQASMPYRAVAYIRQHQPPGPMFNSYNWGGYLIYKLWPDYLLYIDGRTDLYSDAFIRRYIAVSRAEEGWQAALDEAGINLVLIESDSPLGRLLPQEPAWREVYRDEKAAIFVRKQPVGGAS